MGNIMSNIIRTDAVPDYGRGDVLVALAKQRNLKVPNVTMTTAVSQGQFELETKLADVAYNATQSNYFPPNNIDKKAWTSLQRKLARDEFRKLGYKDGEMVEWAGLVASNQEFDFYTRLQGLLFIETLVSNRPPETGTYADVRGIYDKPNETAIMPAIEALTYIASMQVGDDEIRDKAIKLLGDEILYPDTARAIGIALYSVIDAMQDSPSAMHWVAYAAQNIGGAEGYYILDKMSKMDCLNGDDRTSRLTKSLIRAGLHNLTEDMLDYYKWPALPDGSCGIPDMPLDQFLAVDPGRFLPRISMDFQAVRISRMLAKGSEPGWKPERIPVSALPMHPAFLPQVPQLTGTAFKA